MGDIRQAMHIALLALDAVDAAAFGDADADTDDTDADSDPAEDAADAIAAVGAEVQQRGGATPNLVYVDNFLETPPLWHALMGTGDDDE